LAVAAAYGTSLTGAPDALIIPLYTIAIVLGGWSNATKAYRALMQLSFNTSVLMAVAVTGAILIGEWTEAAVVSFLFGVSEMLEAWSLDRARRSVRELMELAPTEAR